MIYGGMFIVWQLDPIGVTNQSLDNTFSLLFCLDIYMLFK